MDPRLKAFSVALLVAALSGCPKSNHAANHPPTDAGTADDEEDAALAYCPPGAPNSLTLSQDVKGKTGVSLRILDAAPNPPERYNNTWTIQFVDDGGNPMDGVEITSAQSKMPYHSHPARPASTIMKLSDPGQYKTVLYMQMPGYFLLSFQISFTKDGAAQTDVIEVPFCLL